MSELEVSTDAAERARARCATAADRLVLDLRAVSPHGGSPTARVALEQWLSWVAMTSGALAARVSSSGDRAAEAAGLLVEADRAAARAHGGAVTGVQVAR
ncbi:hypothetical protein [Cellulomonas sp. RIT-PI-Y]|uniref:hypothetical protein n=1 Tax=Cellulomonas sp. RIT-PI-Y TaxID=3035297 RepID=UPI0021D842C8|nr:hypothetical protein [Cellulomonas sp. RIT-PI-Y]